MDVVVVESPTKAKTINKYLGEGYQVLSSYGHVRDLPERDGSVVPEDDFRMIYEPLADKKKRIDEIAKAVKGADRLFLATDPDREGEAISWHLLAALEDKRATQSVHVQRVVFHEVTKRAVLDAIEHPRALDRHLIDAYQARRALDYLVGFTLSPVLWRKMPGSRSAGRVQSVALRLICEREAEIEAFKAQEYWTVTALLKNGGAPFTARLVALDGKRLDKFALADEAQAKDAVARITRADLAVKEVERKQVSRNPSPPFSTSTMQQEASRKLGFSADRTMKTAQRLFEGVQLDGDTVGLITYMRTDSVQLSGEAMAATRRLIGSRFGDGYLPERPRVFKTKTKNAQEAHEAIRPTDLFREPRSIARHLDDDQRRLYELIWKRTVASQMQAALMNRVTIDVADAGASVGLRATGQTIAFDGFLKLYQEGLDDPSGDEDDDGLLPDLHPGTALRQEKVEPLQHFTEPPPRFTEASLVKKLEELGVGRPSTYASIISVLQNRSYVRLEQRRFVPEDRGRMVTVFLSQFFDQYVQPGFTADLESKLDAVAAGEVEWKEVLRDFWQPFHATVGEVRERRTSEVIDALNEALAIKLFPPRDDGSDPRSCPLCSAGNLSLKLGRFGAFVGCSNYPECRYTRKLGEETSAQERGEERLLGVSPETGEEVWIKSGRFGPYVQEGAGADARRSSLPGSLSAPDVDLAVALKLLALPREIGAHPQTGKPITAGISRYGPFVAHDGQFVRLSDDDDVLSVGMNRAITLIAEAPKGRGMRSGAANAVLKELGEHPDGGPIQVLKGRFGPYVRHGKVNASLKKGMEVESLSLDQAVALIAAKANGKGSGKTASRTTGKKAAGKANGKKPAAKKSTAKKSTAKKAGATKAARTPASSKTAGE